ncbi:MAG: hypothetical protein R3F59_26810 [Myxococcota bacterium]
MDDPTTSDPAAAARNAAVRKANGRAWIVGAVVGIVVGIAGMLVYGFAAMCCLGVLVAPLVPVAAGPLGGGFAAWTPVYAALRPGDGLAVGAQLGARGAGAAAVCSLLGMGLLTIVGMGFVAFNGNTKQDELVIVLGFFGVHGLMMAVGTVIGILLGAGVGGLVGEMRQPMAARPPPTSSPG